MAVWIGTSGWSYDHWEPELYPPGLPVRDRLARYTAALGTAELNSSFYRWPRPAMFSGWRRRLPDGFRLSVKAPRGLSHGRKLYEPETWVQRIAAGWHELADRRGVLLVQLAPADERDDPRLAYFLRLMPDWVRVAVEFRHPSWHCETCSRTSTTMATLTRCGTRGRCVPCSASSPALLPGGRALERRPASGGRRGHGLASMG